MGGGAVRYLWDTHALIWAMEDDPLLSPKARAAARESNRHAIAGISLWEVACLVHKGRIRLSLPIEDWMHAVCDRLPVLSLSGAIAIRCYRLGEFHGDPADRIIVATALVHGLTLVTRDEAMTRHPGLVTLWG